MSRYYCFSDTETAGLVAGTHSLLTSAFVVANEKLEKKAEFLFKYARDIYHVSAEALNVNKLDLIELWTNGIVGSGEKCSRRPANDLNQQMKKDFCRFKNGLYTLKEKGHEIILACHNRPFDKGFLILEHEWMFKDIFSEEGMDTKVDADAARRDGLLKSENSKLDTLRFVLGITHEGAHTALKDTLDTLELARYLRKLRK